MVSNQFRNFIFSKFNNNITVIQVYAPTSNAEEAEVEISYILTQIQRKGGEEKPSEKLKEI